MKKSQKFGGKYPSRGYWKESLSLTLLMPHLKKQPIKKTRCMVAEDLKREWLLQNETICICKGIPRKRFIEAIKKGAATLQEVNRVVGSGGGDCKGERCGPRIERLLAAYLVRSRGDPKKDATGGAVS